MSTLKAQYNESQALLLLGGLHPDAHGLERLAGGEMSQAFGFMSQNTSLVLRVNHHASYATDAAMSKRLAGSAIPVPRVLDVGNDGEHYWAISERASGTTMDSLDPAAHLVLRDDLVQVLLALHATPVKGTSGFGPIDASGNATHPTWRDFLTTEGMADSFVDWDGARSRATPEQTRLIDTAWETAARLIPHCPEDRALLHGDFSLDNILADRDGITGVIDWSNVLHGDPLWDVARTDLWAPHLSFATAYLAARPTEDGDLLIRCYKLMNATNALGFYLHTRQPASADWIAPHIQRLLNEIAANHDR
jgi:hygromycin-B 4-O-kinase